MSPPAAAVAARAALGVAAGREKEAKGRFTLLHEAQTKAQRARETATVKKGGKGVGGVVSKLMGGSKKKKEGGGGGGGPTDAEVAEGDAALASTEAEKEAAAEAAKEANLAYAKLKDAILEEEYELQRLRAAELAEAQEAQADDDGGGSDGGGGGSGDDGGSGDESDDSDFLHDGAPPAGARVVLKGFLCTAKLYGYEQMPPPDFALEWDSRWLALHDDGTLWHADERDDSDADGAGLSGEVGRIDLANIKSIFLSDSGSELVLAQPDRCHLLAADSTSTSTVAQWKEAIEGAREAKLEAAAARQYPPGR